MNPTIETLIFDTIISILMVLSVAIFLFVMFKTGQDLLSSILFSLATGISIAACIVVFFKGIVPFLHGVHIPFKGILILWPLCSAPLVPFVGYNVEITGNVIVDSIIIGGALSLFIAIMGSGNTAISYQECWGKMLQVITCLGLFFGVAVRAVFWAMIE